MSDIVTQINDVLFGREFKTTLLNKENGDPSNGFLHGGSGEKNNNIFDDLTYVNPEPGATEYTYENEDAVLGRSLTNNPRVKFLDPLKHGGSYEVPNIYIEPELPFGWLSFAKLIVPNIDGCEPRATNFLGLADLEKQISQNESKIKRDERLSESPECVVEIPFEKISSPATLATLEQAVYCFTIRIYLTEFMVNSFSIHGNLALNPNNYEELIYEYITKKMQQGLSSETSLFASTYEGYDLVGCLFLEQCAQVFNRRVKLGELQTDLESDRAMREINQAQINYTKPTERHWCFV